MSRRASWVVVVLGLAPGLAARAAAQPPAPFTASDEVRLITVPVRVFAAGRPVTDLVREDFELLEDGEPVEITHFEGWRGGQRTEAAAPKELPAELSSAPVVKAAPSLRLALYIDNVHLSAAGRRRAAAALPPFLEHNLPEGAQVSLVTSDPELNIRVPFTGNVRRILAALDELETSFNSFGMMAEVERLDALSLILEDQRMAIETPLPLDPPCGVELGLFAQSYAEREFTRVQASLATLGSYVESLALLPGRKALVHVSDGLPLSAGLAAYQLANELCDGTGAMQGVALAIDASPGGPAGQETAGELYNPRQGALDMARYTSLGRLEAVAAAAATHGVTFFPLQAIDPGRAVLGSVSEQGRSYTMTGMGIEAANRTETLVAFADRTGGRAVLAHQDLGTALGGLGSELVSGYVLGFYPGHPADDRARRLEVRVRRPGTSLRHPRAYRDTSVETAVGQVLLATLLHEHGTPEEDDPLPFRLERGSPPVASADQPGALAPSTELRIEVPVSGLTLVESEGTRHGLVSLYVSVRFAGGAIAKLRRMTTPVAVGPGASTFRLRVGLDAPPGEHQVGVALRDDLSGALSARVLRVSVKGGP